MSIDSAETQPVPGITFSMNSYERTVTASFSAEMPAEVAVGALGKLGVHDIVFSRDEGVATGEFDSSCDVHQAYWDNL